MNTFRAALHLLDLDYATRDNPAIFASGRNEAAYINYVVSRNPSLLNEALEYENATGVKFIADNVANGTIKNLERPEIDSLRLKQFIDLFGELI
jgi:hypothetical protein